MNVLAGELKAGMYVLRGLVATPDAWVELADPPVDWTPAGGWLSLRYVDGSCSRPMQANHRVEVRPPSLGPVS